MGKMMNFAHINAHGDIPKILNHLGLEFTQKGDQIRLCCPFHDDSNPSLSITLIDTDQAKAGTWHCFGCGEKGSPIDFLARVQGLEDDLRTAAERVATISGISLAPPRSGRQRKAKAGNSPQARGEAPERLAEANQARGGQKDDKPPSSGVQRQNEPLKFTLELDMQHTSVLRRLDSEAAEHFGVGFLADTSRSMMAGRICIPIHNLDGDLVAYVGRWPDDDPPDDEEKYRFPPKFEKLGELYNLHRLGQSPHIVVVEGFFSAMRLHQLGVPVVALMGTAMSAEQVALLQAHGVKSVLVLLDGDEPGRLAAPRVVKALVENLFVRVVTLPDGSSPDDMPEAELQQHLPFPLRNRL